MSISTTLPARTAGHRPGVALAVIVTCQLMIGLDATIVTIALPRIGESLSFSPTGLSWVQNAYMLTFGGLLLLGGRAGDILGRRRVFVAGVLVFTLASLLGGLASGGPWLIAARALQGLGAAIAGPSTLSLIATTFAQGHARNRALSLYSAVSGGGASVGLILGGVLTDWTSWRWVFFVNVPIGLTVALLAPRFVPETEHRTGSFDVAGALSSTAGMISLVYAFIRVAERGWGDGAAVAAFAVAIVLLATFAAVESRARQPVMPLRLLSNRDTVAAYVLQLLLCAAMFGMFFFITQFLQVILALEPLMAGLAFLPMMLGQFGFVRLVPRLLPRFGPRTLVITGTILITAGLAWLSRIDASTPYLPGIIGPMLLFGIGGGITFMPLNVTILSGAAPEDSGAVSGLAQTMIWAGGSLGSAVLVTVFGTTTGGGTTPEVLAHGIANAFTTALVFAAIALCGAVLVIGRSVEPRGDAIAVEQIGPRE